MGSTVLFLPHLRYVAILCWFYSRMHSPRRTLPSQLQQGEGKPRGGQNRGQAKTPLMGQSCTVPEPGKSGRVVTALIDQ